MNELHCAQHTMYVICAVRHLCCTTYYVRLTLTIITPNVEVNCTANTTTYNVRRSLYVKHSNNTFHDIRCMPYIVGRTLYDEHSTSYIVHYTSYIVHYTSSGVKSCFIAQRLINNHHQIPARVVLHQRQTQNSSQ